MSRSSANLSDIQRYNITCHTIAGIPIVEGSENNTDIPCLEKVLEKCQPFEAFLEYSLGSMRVSIKGLTNGSCLLCLDREIERGQTNLICTIPVSKMSSWTNWKRGTDSMLSTRLASIVEYYSKLG